MQQAAANRAPRHHRYTALGVLLQRQPSDAHPGGLRARRQSRDEHTLTLDLDGIPLTLRSARIAATYSGSPASTLVNGLIRAFLTQADADINFTANAVSYTGPQLDALTSVQQPILLAVSPSPIGAGLPLGIRAALDGRVREGGDGRPWPLQFPDEVTPVREHNVPMRHSTSRWPRVAMSLAWARITGLTATRSHAEPASLLAASYRGYGMTGDPRAVAVGDFNKDSWPDLAVANTGSSVNAVSVLLGRPSGGFAPAVRWATGYWPSSVAIGDLDREGELDLVVTNDGAASVSVLDGFGDGTFAAHRDFPAGVNPVGVAVGDADGDGLPDVVVTNINDSVVALLHGDGNGGLAAPVPHYCGSAPTAVAIGQVDADPAPDLIVGNDVGEQTIAVLRGTGGGVFLAPAQYGTTGFAFDIAVGDLNQDGRLDFVAPAYDPFVSVVLGDGLGGFGARTDYATGYQCHSVALADLDGDGNMDIITANGGANTITFLPGHGNGGFGPRQDYGTGDQPSDLAVADLNRDGRLDVVTANASGASVTVLYGIQGLAGVPPVAATSALQLAPARPTPALHDVELSFTLARASAVSLQLVDIAGRSVRHWDNGVLAAGPHSLRWDGTREDGAQAPPGIYLCELTAGSTRGTWRVILTR